MWKNCLTQYLVCKWANDWEVNNLGLNTWYNHWLLGDLLCLLELDIVILWHYGFLLKKRYKVASN